MDTPYKRKLPEITTEVFTGKLTEAQQQMAGEVLKNRAKRIVALVGEELLEQMQQEPFLLPDEFRAIHPGQLLINLLWQGSEILVGHDSQGVIGVQIFDCLKPGHKAHWHLWIAPVRRRTKAMKAFILEGLSYAFVSAPEGLGLYKVIIMSCNREALVPAERWLGFNLVGVLQYEAFYNGTLSSIMVLERYNPALEVGADGQRRRVGQPTERDTTSSNDGGGQPVHSALRASEFSDTTSTDGDVQLSTEQRGVAGTEQHVHTNSGANVHAIERPKANTNSKVSSRSSRRRKRR